MINHKIMNLKAISPDIDEPSKEVVCSREGRLTSAGQEVSSGVGAHKSPLCCAKVTVDGARDHSMDHTDDVHHASALKPQPRAATHLQPP